MHELPVWFCARRCLARCCALGLTASLATCDVGGGSIAPPGQAAEATPNPASPSSTKAFLEPAATAFSVGPCLPGRGHDYQVGPGAGQLASLAMVPWDRLAAGDTVRIFYRAAAYPGKILLIANGTEKAPVRVCGVKGPLGERPVITGEGAIIRSGLVFGGASSAAVQEARAVVMIKATSEDWTHFPSHLQIDGLAIRSAHPNYQFTDSRGVMQRYSDFGACIWVDRGKNVTIADNEISDCTNGIFSKSTDDGDFAVSTNLRIAGNLIHGNGVVGSDRMHNTYVQSINVVYEFNVYGPLRAGAGGIALKDRSAGAVIRYNRIEEGAHAMDLVEAEDFPLLAVATPAYRATYVYGNQISKSGDTGSFIHYGGDHSDSEPGANWGEPWFRKGTLYFFNNTVYATGAAARLFQLSTTEEKAEVWNNVFYFAPSVRYASMRSGQDVGPAWTPGGILNLGRNWISAKWADSDPDHPLKGQLNGKANMITGSSAPIDLNTFIPLEGSSIIDAAQAAVAGASAHPVTRQLAGHLPQPRSTRGAGDDLGAVER